MNANQALIQQHVNKMLHEVIAAARQCGQGRPSGKALLAFLTRGAGSWKSLRILAHATQGNTPEWDWIGNDCAAILRCMFDAYIQAAYVFHDPETRESLGDLYLEYELVECHQLSQAIIRLDNPFARRIAQSPLRETGEKANTEAYDRVRRNYPRRKSRGVRKTWYDGGLFALAKAIGKDDEYVVLVKALHGSIHSSPLAMSKGPLYDKDAVVLLSDILVGRLAHMVVENGQVSISEDSRKIIAALQAEPLKQETRNG